MTRPRKNNADYFSHDKTMRNDSKIQAVRSKFGNDGYAVWNMLLEVLTDCDNFSMELKSNLQWEILSGDFRIETNKLKEIIGYFSKIGLVVIDGKNLIIPNLNERLQPLLDDRERKREWANKRWSELKTGQTELKTSKTELSTSETMQSKVKESKVKNIYTQSDFVSCDYIGHLRKDNRRDLRIIGLYFEEAKMEFPSKEAADKELKRWLKTAKTLKDYSDEKILKAFKVAKTKHKELWKLSTVEKEIPSVK